MDKGEVEDGDMANEPVTDIVPDVEGYEKVPTQMLKRLAAGGDEDAEWELARRVPPPAGAPDPHAPPTGEGGSEWADSVVNDEPYYAMPIQLLRNLVAEGGIGAAEELDRRGLPTR